MAVYLPLQRRERHGWKLNNPARVLKPAREANKSVRVLSPRGVVLVCAGLYFLVLLAASVVFTVDAPNQGITFDAYRQIVSADGFGSSLLLSLELAAATIAAVLLLMVPAMVALRLGAPAAARGGGDLLAAAGRPADRLRRRDRHGPQAGTRTPLPHPALRDVRGTPEPRLPL